MTAVPSREYAEIRLESNFLKVCWSPWQKRAKAIYKTGVAVYISMDFWLNGEEQRKPSSRLAIARKGGKGNVQSYRQFV